MTGHATEILNNAEKFKAALAECGSDRKLAEKLGVNKDTVASRRKKYGLDSPERETKRTTPEELRSSLLRGVVPLSKAAESVGMTLLEFSKLVAEWRGNGYNVITLPEGITISREIQLVKREVSTEFYGNSFRVALVGDTHGSSQHEKLDELNAFYDLCVEREVRDVLHAGDICAGVDVYKGQIYEVKPGHYGYDAQWQHLVDNYPKREGITTHYILGNHDLSHMKKSGADISLAIDVRRSDMQCVGHMGGRVEVSGLKVDLLHPRGGNPYALSYRAQKTNEALGRKANLPHVKANGHLHTSFFADYMDICEFQVGCFEGQTSFVKSMGIDPVIGGWIVEVNMHGGEVNRCAPEFVRLA